MPTTYVKAEPEVHELLRSVLEQYHPALLKHKVTFGILFAHAPVKKDGSPTGKPAIKGYGGAAAGACVKNLTLKDRITKGYCVELLICAETWLSLDDREKVALLDHESTHPELTKDKDGNVKTDDYGWPCLKMRKDDVIVWGFSEVMKRHGRNALEWQSIRRLVDSHHQLLLDGIPQAADTVEIEIRPGAGTVMVHAAELRKLEGE